MEVTMSDFASLFLIVVAILCLTAHVSWLWLCIAYLNDDNKKGTEDDDDETE